MTSHSEELASDLAQVRRILHETQRHADYLDRRLAAEKKTTTRLHAERDELREELARALKQASDAQERADRADERAARNVSPLPLDHTAGRVLSTLRGILQCEPGRSIVDCACEASQARASAILEAQHATRHVDRLRAELQEKTEESESRLEELHELRGAWSAMVGEVDRLRSERNALRNGTGPIVPTPHVQARADESAKVRDWLALLQGETRAQLFERIVRQRDTLHTYMADLRAANAELARLRARI